MADDQAKGSIEDRISAYHAEPGVEGKQPEVMPASEKPTEVPPAEVKTETKVEVKPEEAEEKEALDNSKNPERTRAYIERLRRERDEAREKAQPKEEVTTNLTSAFDILHPEKQETNMEPTVQPGQIPAPQFNPQQRVQTPYLNPLQVQNITQQFVDAQGNVDINGLNAALQRANYDGYQARLEVQTLRQQIQRAEETRQVREAHAQHPEIDPQAKDKFDKNLFNLVTDRIVKNMMAGRNESLLEVASSVKRDINYQPKVDTKAVSQKAVQDYKETQRARNQGPFEEGRGEERRDMGSLEDLRKASRTKGPAADRAIAARLKALGI